MATEPETAEPDTSAPPEKRDKTHWLYIAVIVAVVGGVIVGLLAPGVGKSVGVLGTMFVALIKMMIVPVIFCTIVLGIVTLATISLTCADELASGSRLGRAVCIYGALSWGIRVSLQPVFDVKEHLTAWWLKLGYHTLTVLFLFFTAVYAYAALR